MRTFKHLDKTINGEWENDEIKTYKWQDKLLQNSYPFYVYQTLNYKKQYRMIKCYIWSFLLDGMDSGENIN